MASEIKVDTIVNAGGDNDSGIDLSTNDAVKIKIANAVKAEVDSSGHVKLDTVKGYTSAASISVVGEGGSNTTNLQQGLAKVWFLFNGQGTASITDSFNVSSLDDDGTGQYGLHYTNNLATANQGAGSDVGSGNASGTCMYVNFHTTTTSTVDMDTWQLGIGGDLAQGDYTTIRGVILGDLA